MEHPAMIAKKLFIKPKVPGTVVRRPDREGQPLPEDGAWVDASGGNANYWHARLLNGDVVEAEPPREPSDTEFPIAHESEHR
jgi:hypothetical protein